jgi:hypothetical protein
MCQCAPAVGVPGGVQKPGGGASGGVKNATIVVSAAQVLGGEQWFALRAANQVRLILSQRSAVL